MSSRHWKCQLQHAYSNTEAHEVTPSTAGRKNHHGKQRTRSQVILIMPTTYMISAFTCRGLRQTVQFTEARQAGELEAGPPSFHTDECKHCELPRKTPMLAANSSGHKPRTLGSPSKQRVLLRAAGLGHCYLPGFGSFYFFLLLL